MLWVSGAESWGPLYFEHLYYSSERLADIFGEPLDEAPSVENLFEAWHSWVPHSFLRLALFTPKIIASI